VWVCQIIPCDEFAVCDPIVQASLRQLSGKHNNLNEAHEAQGAQAALLTASGETEALVPDFVPHRRRRDAVATLVMGSVFSRLRREVAAAG